MATIKVQVDESGARRVITKLVDGNRVASCACCAVGGECCVYPASCGIGPESVEHYGSTIAGSGTSFGDTTNGVILESGVWAVYRNGSRTTKTCLGMALPSASVNVAAVLSSTYALNVTGPGINISSTLSYDGAIAPGVFDINVVGNVEGQCIWTGISGSQDFDSGFSLFFSPANCRWQIASGPMDAVFAYLAADLPPGSYTSTDPSYTWTIS